MCMHFLFKLGLVFPLVLCAAFAQEQKKNWGHYRTILTSGMFPQPPKIVDPITVTQTPVVAAPVDRWELDYKVHMVYRHIKSGETIVGVQHIKGAAPGFNLRVGEQHASERVRLLKVEDNRGLTVVTLEKDGREVPFEISNILSAPKSPAIPVPAKLPRSRRVSP